MTPKAVEAIARQMKKRGTPDAALRLGIRGGGCSGFTYVIEFHDGAPRARDRVFDYTATDGTPVRVVVDPKSLLYLGGTDARVGADADAAGLQVREPEREDRLRLRSLVHRLSRGLTMDPFATLGIARAATTSTSRRVEKTHRELSRALHPDGTSSAGASERRAALSKAVEVNEAWRIVRDPIRRAEALLALARRRGRRGAQRAASRARSS